MRERIDGVRRDNICQKTPGHGRQIGVLVGFQPGAKVMQTA